MITALKYFSYSYSLILEVGEKKNYHGCVNINLREEFGIFG